MSSYSYPSRRTPAMEAAGVFPKITGLCITISKGDNINGDPSAGGKPRQLSNDHGLQSVVSAWRKYRDMIDSEHPVALLAATEMGISLDDFKILFKKLPDKNARAEMARLIIASEAEGKIVHHDYRLRGGMLVGSEDSEDDGEDTEGSEEAPKKKAKKEKKAFASKIAPGILQMGNAISVAPITIDDMQITSCIGHGEKSGAMGNVPSVRFGIYPMPIYINTSKHMWKKLGTIPEDIEFFRRVFPSITEMRSSVRNNWYIRNFYWYEHQSMSGDIADWRIIEALTPRLKDGIDPLDPDLVSDEHSYIFFDPTSDEAKVTFKDNIEHLHDFAK